MLDLRTVPIPVARYYTRAVDASGGVHVRLSPYDQRVVDIRFIDSRGLNLTREQERAVEQAFFREDFRRVYMDDIGNIDYAADVADVYMRGYLAAIDVQAVRAAQFKLVVDYAHAPTADVLPIVLERLNVDVVPLNARVDPNKISLLQEEFNAERAQLATITGALGDTSLGVRLDIGGEKMFVADDTGTSVPDTVMCSGDGCPGFPLLSRGHYRRHSRPVQRIRAPGRALRRPRAPLFRGPTGHDGSCGQ